jgi:hypothetical protein
MELDNLVPIDTLPKLLFDLRIYLCIWKNCLPSDLLAVRAGYWISVSVNNVVPEAMGVFLLKWGKNSVVLNQILEL